jgi:hypothetical protein
MTVMVTNESIQFLFDYLMDTLETGNWKVDFEILDPQKMIEVDASESGYTNGNIKVYGQHEEAMIYLNKKCIEKFDTTINHVLIHEFIHLLMYDFDSYINAKFPDTYKDDYFNELEEQFVNRMSKSIWNMLNTIYTNESYKDDDDIDE